MLPSFRYIWWSFLPLSRMVIRPRWVDIGNNRHSTISFRQKGAWNHGDCALGRRADSEFLYTAGHLGQHVGVTLGIIATTQSPSGKRGLESRRTLYRPQGR